MNKSQICSEVSRAHGLSLNDAEVLYQVYTSADHCEISYPPSMPESERNRFRKAYSFMQDLIEQHDDEMVQNMEAKVALIPSQSININEFVDHFQSILGNKFVVSETGTHINHRSPPSEEELEIAISSISLSGQSFERAHCMLQWALADLTAALTREKQDRDLVLNMVSSAFNINRENLRRLVNMSVLVPRHKRIPGWTWRHYQQVFKYAPSMEPYQINQACNELAKGRSIKFQLANGIVLQNKKPLTYRQVDAHMAKLTGRTKKPKNKSMGRRYLYIVNGRSYFSDDLDEHSVLDPAIQVIDCLLSAEVNGPNKVRQLLPQFDPDNSGSFSTHLGLNPYRG